MRRLTTAYVTIVLLVTASTGWAQSAFLDRDRSGTAIALGYTRQEGVSGYGLAAGLSTEGTSDAVASVFMLDTRGSNPYGFGLHYMPMGRSVDDNLIGVPLGIEYMHVPNQEAILTGSIGLTLGISAKTGPNSRLAFTVNGTLGYALAGYSPGADRTAEVISADAGLTVPLGEQSCWLISFTVGHGSGNPGYDFVGFELGMLFLDK